MKIVDIQGFHLRLVPERPLGNARMFIRQREFLLVQVVCDDGTNGWGEAFASPWAAATLIRKQYGPALLGRSPEQFGRIYTEFTGALGYDRRGPAMMAISAIDIALHDAAARTRGMSVAAMLGGRLRDRVPAYASGPFMREVADPYAHYEAETEACLKRGFKALKPRAGLSPRRDGEMVNALRRVIGPDLGLMVDINQGYTAGAACASARAMAEAGLLWIEEPVLPEDIAGYRAVAAASHVPIAGGEALASPAAYREFLEARALGLLQPDMAVCGGFSGFQRIAGLASAYDLPLMPHVFGTAVNLHAGLQMASLLPARRGGGPAPYPFIEYDATDNPLMDLFGFPLGADGCVPVPDGPGLGIEPTPAMLEPWAVERWSVAA